MQGDVVFLHEIVAGAADRSYGIHVAKLAGLPSAVIARAEEILSILEQGEQSSSLTGLADNLPLFEKANNKPPPKILSPTESAISDIDPDQITPREALELIYQLKRDLH